MQRGAVLHLPTVRGFTPVARRLGKGALEGWVLPSPLYQACGTSEHRNIGTQHPIDKQIAAIAIIYDLTVVTRKMEDFESTGLRDINPFSSSLPMN